MNTNVNKSYTKSDILSQLSAINAPRDKIVLMHTSLRLIGKIEGGAKTLLDALIEYFTSDGGLFCVPTHTWANLGNDITLDMTSPKTCLGAFSDFAAADGRGIRSQNPTHSMVVFGNREKALEFIKDEPKITSGTSPESCYGKIYREGGYILLVGVGHNRNTYLHCVEEIIDTENRLAPEPKITTVKLQSGEIYKQKIRGHKTTFTNDVSQRFRKYEIAFRYHKAITDGFIGNAPAQLCDAKIMKEVMELILKRSEGKDPLIDEMEISPKLYC